MRWNIIGYVILVIGLALALYTYTNTRTSELRTASFRSCERLNVVRAQSNLSDIAVWTILSGAYQREVSLSKSDTESREVHKRSASILLMNANRMTIIQLTSCRDAVDHPERVETVLPQAIGNIETGRLYDTSKDIESDSENLTH